MRRRIGWTIAVAACLAAVAVMADDPAVYGQGVRINETLTVADLLVQPERYVDRVVQVEGVITYVCPIPGCWIDLSEKDASRKIRFEPKDGEIVFPREVQGHRAVVEGTFRRLALNEQEAASRARREAELRGEPFDRASVTGPRTIYVIEGTGAVVQ